MTFIADLDIIHQIKRPTFSRTVEMIDLFVKDRYSLLPSWLMVMSVQ